MLIFVTAFATIFGLLIGSFLNVVVYRVPAGLSIVSPGSACPRCDQEIAWYDNIPIVSWIVLKAKCRGCALPISVRYPLVEALTAALFAVLAVASPRLSLIPMLCLLGAACFALGIIDWETMKLPDPIVLTAAIFTVAGVVLDGVLSGHWPVERAGLSALVWSLVFGIPWFVSAGKWMGFGDVKLAPVLGLALGWLGWGASLIGLFGGFLLGAVVGMAIGAMQGHQKGRRIPFGPFMVAGALLGVLAGAPLWDLYLDLFFPAL